MMHIPTSVAVTVLATLATNGASAATYGCHITTGQHAQPPTIVIVNKDKVAVMTNGLSISGETPSTLLPNVTYFAFRDESDPVWGARFKPTRALMYRYSLDLDSGDVTYETPDSSIAAGHCTVIAEQ